MTAADRNSRPPHRLDGPPVGSTVDHGHAVHVLAQRQVFTEATTFVLCGPAAVVLLTLVAFQGWPPWLLVSAGMLLAWAGDALWTVAEHLIGVVVARRRVSREHPSEAEAGGTAPHELSQPWPGDAQRVGDQR